MASTSLHGEVVVIEAVVLDGGQAVGYGAYAHALNVVGVVPCTARVVVLALLDAVVGPVWRGRGRACTGRISVRSRCCRRP